MDLSTDREAYAFAERVLESAEPKAVVISAGDSQTFALWYLRYGLGKRPDVAVVDRNLLAFDWYRDQVSRQDADVPVVQGYDAESAAVRLIKVTGMERPVHLTYEDPYLQSLANWTRQEPLLTLSTNRP